MLQFVDVYKSNFQKPCGPFLRLILRLKDFEIGKRKTSMELLKKSISIRHLERLTGISRTFILKA